MRLSPLLTAQLCNQNIRNKLTDDTNLGVTKYQIVVVPPQINPYIEVITLTLEIRLITPVNQSIKSLILMNTYRVHFEYL